MGFTKAQLAAHRGAVVDDLLGDGCRLLFVGINPSLWTAATGAHFARPGNRFYPALYRAGIVDRLIDASDGYTAADRELLLRRGIGITNLAPRATARADELTPDELRDGTQRLIETVRTAAPRVVAVAGITAYRTAFRRPNAVTGEQDEQLAGTPLWIVPNPSGLNAHDTVDSLAAAYRRVGQAAGIVAAG